MNVEYFFHPLKWVITNFDGYFVLIYVKVPQNALNVFIKCVRHWTIDIFRVMISKIHRSSIDQHSSITMNLTRYLNRTEFTQINSLYITQLMLISCAGGFDSHTGLQINGSLHFPYGNVIWASLLTLCEMVQWWPVDSPHKRQVLRELFPCQAIIMFCTSAR